MTNNGTKKAAQNNAYDTIMIMNMLSPSFKFSGLLGSTVYPAKNIGGTI